MKYIYTATFAPFADGSGYECRVPDIPHCVTSGRDIAEALDMIQDAASAMLTVYEDDHTPVPAASEPASVRAPEGGFSTIIQMDTDQYRRMTDNRSVRRSVKLPAWMDNMVQQRRINLSETLQDALRAQLGV